MQTDKNLAVRKFFAFSDSGFLLPRDKNRDACCPPYSMDKEAARPSLHWPGGGRSDEEQAGGESCWPQDLADLISLLCSFNFVMEHKWKCNQIVSFGRGRHIERPL